MGRGLVPASTAEVVHMSGTTPDFWLMLAGMLGFGWLLVSSW